MRALTISLSTCLIVLNTLSYETSASVHNNSSHTGGAQQNFLRAREDRGSSETIELEQGNATKRELLGDVARIIGGDVSSLGEFPYYVDMDGCGGSLIAPNVVLSAAHCGNYQGSSVIVGAYKRDSTNTAGATRVTVNAWKRHPNYNAETSKNDFALLRLESPVTLNSPIALSIDDKRTLVNGEPLDVIGLGITREGSENLADTLRDVRVEAIDTSICNRAAWYDGEVDDATMFCAGFESGGKDSCQGDSGGPIVRRVGNSHVQVGVVSWGYGCARFRSPGVYSRVGAAHDWIKSVVCDEWRSSGTFCGNGGTGGGGDSPSGTGNCAADQFDFDFTIRTDAWGEETSWTLMAGRKRILRGGGFNDNQTYRVQKCLPKRAYKLVIMDSYGDGMGDSDNAGYHVKVDGRVIKESFGSQAEWSRRIVRFS